MKIEIKNSIINEIGDIPEQFNSNLDDFLVSAIRNYINICNVVLEKDIPETEDFHEYPVLKYEVGRLMKTLKNKGIEAQLVKNPDDRNDIKILAKVSSKDFGYIKSISKNHSLIVPDPPLEEMKTGTKMDQLSRMYD
jgi:hypothetical protein